MLRPRAPQRVSLMTSDTSEYTSTEIAAAALVEGSLAATHGQPVALEDLVRAHPDLKALLMAMPLRLVPLIQLFPQFVLTPAHTLDRLEVHLASSSEGTARVDLVAAEAAFSAALGAKLLQYHTSRSSQPTEPVPLAWTVRSLGSLVELLVVCSAEPTLLYHLAPARFGYETRWAAWWGCTSAHVAAFVGRHAGDFVWHGHGTDAAIALTHDAVQQLARQRETERALKRERRRASAVSERGAVKPRADTLISAWVHQNEFLSPQMLLRACSKGGHVLVCRGAARSGAAACDF